MGANPEAVFISNFSILEQLYSTKTQPDELPYSHYPFGLCQGAALTQGIEKMRGQRAGSADWPARGWCLLTAGPVAVIAEVLLLELRADTRLVPHLADLRHAQLGVEVEGESPRFDGQVVLGPVPQVLEVLVIQRREGIQSTREESKRQLCQAMTWKHHEA